MKDDIVNGCERPLEFNLELMCVGSCTCGVKTPDITYHHSDCHYRTLQQAVAALRGKDERIDALSAEVARLSAAPLQEEVERLREQNRNLLMMALAAITAEGGEIRVPPSAMKDLWRYNLHKVVDPASENIILRAALSTEAEGVGVFGDDEPWPSR